MDTKHAPKRPPIGHLAPPLAQMDLCIQAYIHTDIDVYTKRCMPTYMHTSFFAHNYEQWWSLNPQNACILAAAFGQLLRTERLPSER